MVRKRRVWFPGAAYHVTARGNRKSTLFYDNNDYGYYLALLSGCMRKMPFDIHAYCLMPNHIHLLLETKDHSLTSLIQFVHFRYAIEFNKRYKLTGHVFQGRYNAKLIDSPYYFLKASRYIHLNPQESDLVTSPQKYKWSSYPAYKQIENGKEYPFTVPPIRTERILSYFGEGNQGKYQSFVEGPGPKV